MTRFRMAVGSLAAGGLLFSAAAAGADPGPATHVDSLSAAVGANTIAVSGGATFVDVPVLVGEDSSGDAPVPGAGLDLTTLNISRALGSSSGLTFKLGVADPFPTYGGIPSVTHYHWTINVVNGEDVVPFVLQAIPRNGPPLIRVFRYNADGTCCTGGQNLTGAIANGSVDWVVPLTRIGAKVGSIIQAGPDGVQVNPGADGQAWLRNGVAALDAASQDVEYTVPGVEVRIGIAPAGTPEDEVSLGFAGAVNQTNGSFTGTLVKPASPGSYLIVAQACYGPENCGTASTTITV